MGLNGFTLFGTLCVSETCVSFSFTRAGKLLVITSSNKFSILYLPFSSSETPMIWMLLYFMLSQRSLKVSFFIIFFFAVLIGCFFLPCLPNCWFNLLLHSTFYLFLPVYSFKKRFYLFIFREGKGGRKRGREIAMCGCVLCAPYWGSGLQPRHVP